VCWVGLQELLKNCYSLRCIFVIFKNKNKKNIFLRIGRPYFYADLSRPNNAGIRQLKRCHDIQLDDTQYCSDLDRLAIFNSVTTSLLHSQLKRLHFLSLLIRLSVYQTQASSFDVLISFVYNFYFS
jgi:hypothetical protein